MPLVVRCAQSRLGYRYKCITQVELFDVADADWQSELQTTKETMHALQKTTAHRILALLSKLITYNSYAVAHGRYFIGVNTSACQ